MIVLTVLLFLLGAAVLVTGLLGLTGKLPGNRWVGLHIPEVRKSREMWDTGHRIIGPFWTGAGIAILLGGVVSLKGGWLWAVAVLLLVGGVLLVGIGAANASHIMAQIDLRKGQDAEAQRAAAGCCSSGSGDAKDATSTATGDARGGAVSSVSTGAGGAAFSVPPVSADTGAQVSGDSCGGSCADCGACDHADEETPGAARATGVAGATSTASSTAASVTPPVVAPDVDAARRAMAARDNQES